MNENDSVEQLDVFGSSPGGTAVAVVHVPGFGLPDSQLDSIPELVRVDVVTFVKQLYAVVPVSNDSTEVVTGVCPDESN